MLDPKRFLDQYAQIAQQQLRKRIEEEAAKIAAEVAAELAFHLKADFARLVDGRCDVTLAIDFGGKSK